MRDNFSAMEEPNLQPHPALTPTHQRRARYSGKNPRHFDQKYKEQNPGKYADTVAKVLASGKTPAGTHRPIMVAEILEALRPAPGEIAIDGTLGYGGHAREILAKIQPGGKLIGLDVDATELAKTEARLRETGFGLTTFAAYKMNFAGLPQVLQKEKLSGVDLILADLGVSSMQIDNPARGFSIKQDGPLDMRMNPERGQSASAFLEKINADALENLLFLNSDEPQAKLLAGALAGKKFLTTGQLARAVKAILPHKQREELELTVRRVFQAVRIAVNDEFSALEMFLRHAPFCLKPGGRIAVLTFHSGEDRRVKKAFSTGQREGVYEFVTSEVIRATPEEQRDNPRSSPAKLRWARKSPT
ncbi:MAG: 16S rRNA (cytosine(1402)-N(4))-methyltransferase RsmH [Verrucomicrobiota bacterium]